MKDGIGKGFTRDDHPNLSSQLFASVSRVQDVRALASVVGSDELGKQDKASLAFGELFEDKFLRQGDDEDRDIGFSLDKGWEILSVLPREQLTRVSTEEARKHLKG
jgi:V/A-type H+-transporting ATPase subunit B